MTSRPVHIRPRRNLAARPEREALQRARIDQAARGLGGQLDVALSQILRLTIARRIGLDELLPAEPPSVGVTWRWR